MPHLLSISLLVLSGIGLLLWVASYAVPSLRAQAETPRFLVRCIFTAIVLLFLYASFRKNRNGSEYIVLIHTLVAGAALIVLWGRLIAGALAGPFSGLFDGGGERVKPEPFYSIAEARRKQGHYHEALWEIQAQLEKFPGDYRGQMLLAEIQVENLNDLAGAEATIHRICSQKHPPNRIAAAFFTLADWHLKHAQDVEAARAAFQEVIDRYPDTELARQAEGRIAHIGETAALVDAREPRTLQMRSVPALSPTAAAGLDPGVDPQAEAERLTSHLAQFPNDTEAREEMAKLYAQAFGRIDLATEQLEQLLALPDQSPRRVAQWLNLLADLQVQCTGDIELASATLHRIIDRFPGHAFADAARDRLQYLRLEIKRFEKQRSVKLKPE